MAVAVRVVVVVVVVVAGGCEAGGSVGKVVVGLVEVCQAGLVDGCLKELPLFLVRGD